MKKVLVKYLCVGLVWSFLVVVAWIVEKFNDIDATFFLIAWMCFLILKRDYEHNNENDGSNKD